MTHLNNLKGLGFKFYILTSFADISSLLFYENRSAFISAETCDVCDSCDLYNL